MPAIGHMRHGFPGMTFANPHARHGLPYMTYGEARNFDYPMPQQGRMVKQQLARMVMDATALYQTLDDNDRLPAWTLLKINTAEDRLHAAADYLRYKARPGLDSYGATAAEAAAAASFQQTAEDAGKGTALLFGVATVAGVLWLFSQLAGPAEPVK